MSDIKKLLVRCSCNTDIGIVELDGDVENNTGFIIKDAIIPFEVAEQTGNHIKRGHQTNLLEI